MSKATTHNIFIVDNNKDDRLNLLAIIEKRFDNINVIEADSALTALSTLIKSTVDLILLEVDMPRMDGFEMAKIIQSRPKTRHIPIVFLTANSQSEEFQTKTQELGLGDYLNEPIDADQLSNKIQLYLRFIQQQEEHHLLEIEQVPVPPANLASLEIARISGIEENLALKLRNKLRTILTYSDVLENSALDLGYQDFVSGLGVINFESQQMLNLINENLAAK